MSTLAALRSPVFRRLQAAGAVSSIGDWMQITARAVLVFALTGSTSALGAVYAAQYVPQIVLLPVAGLIADRIDRRKLVIATNVVQTLCAATLALLTGTGSITVTWIILLSLVAGTAQTLGAPAGLALLPTLVDREHVASAVTLSITVSNVARIVGPILANAVIATAGITSAFWANAASFLGVLIVWLTSRVDGRAGLVPEPTTLASIAQGWRTVRSRASLLVPVGHLAVLSVVGLVYQPLGVAFATDVLAHGDRSQGQGYFGLLQAAIGVGALVGVLGSARLLDRPSFGLGATGVLFAVSLGALAASGSIVPAVLSAFALGVGHFGQSNLVLVMAQSQVPDHLRGRVMAVVMIAWVGLLPISSTFFGALTEVVSIPTAFAGAAVVCGIASVLVTRFSLEDEPARSLT